MGLLAGSAVLVLLVSGMMLTVSLRSTRSIAEAVAAPLLDSAMQETQMRLNALFDPIRRQIMADYVAIRLGALRFDGPVHLKDTMVPQLHAMPQAGSMMLGDADGRQYLALRYDQAAHDSPLLAGEIGRLPPPQAARPQYLTRDVRPATWGDRSHWSLWSYAANEVEATWDLEMPGYDARDRPWYKSAMEKFKDVPLAEALADTGSLPVWTEAYTMFTTKTPGMSATVAARGPDGAVLIVAYDLLLDEIAEFTEHAAPGSHGQVFVMTDDGRLIGPPVARDGGDPAGRKEAMLRPIEQTPFPQMVASVSSWRTRPRNAPARWSMRIDGERWWTGFSEFPISDGRRLWIGVLLPEQDLVPAARAGQTAILRITAAALLVAGLLAIVFARGFSVPLAELSAQSRRIAQLDLADQKLVRSHVAELQALSNDLGEMRRALHEHVTRGELARRELEERETQIRTLAENTPDIVTRFRCDGIFAYANPAFEAASGLSPEEVTGRRITDLPFPADVAGRWMEALKQVCDTGNLLRLEFSYPSPHGVRDYEARLAPERDPAGRIHSVVVVSRDVTERREALQRQAELESQLRQAQKLEAVGLLAGGVAHDFNNLLQVIGGSAALVSPHAPPQENAELIQAIRDAVLRASQMTRQLLVFSRRQQPKLESLDLREIVAGHLKMLRRMMPEDITIRFDAPAAPVCVQADQGGIDQVLLNLCVNAREAMPQGGSIVVSLAVVDIPDHGHPGLPAGRYGRLEVADTGHGIRADVIERIFEPFFSTKPREKGTGLGLSVVYGIVHQHRGHIEARNRPEGGAAFVVHLPLAAEARAAEPESEANDGGAGAGTILLAEDDDQVRSLATRVLERGGYTVVAARSGTEAVNRFKDIAPTVDLLFLDVLMPGLGGFETARRCREIRPDIPVLFASGYAAESLQESVAASAHVEVLTKPYDPGRLLARVKGLLAGGGERRA